MNSVTREMDLTGKTALVTGGAGGLGEVIGSTLAELGCNIVLVDINNQKLSDTKLRIEEKFKCNVEIAVCDLESEEQRSDLISVFGSKGKNLDILINNAAFVGASDLPGWSVPFEEQSISTFRRAIEVNLVSAFHLSRDLSKHMLDSGSGTIINIASIYGQYAPDWKIYDGTDMANPAAYAASKAGLIQLTRWMATTLAPGIRVNAISPGGVKNNQPKSFVDAYEERTPLGRMADYQDFVGAVTFLSTGMSKYVTGQVLNVDGGWGVW
jgi:NAD(P)-dependent dehydrogenase (short-subunit alcohol dehydrogenase family)